MSLFFSPVFQATDSNAAPLAGATWTFFESQTTLKIPTYQDADRSALHENPVVADAAGRFPPIFLNSDYIYRAILKSAGGEVISDVDPISPRDAAALSDITTERQRRISGDQLLHAEIAAEAAARAAGLAAAGDEIDALDTRTAVLEGTIASGRLAYATYAGLAADTGAVAGSVAEVPLTDTGTHTDPVVGGTVANTGIFRWSASPAGWERLYDVDAASAAVDRAAAEAAADAAAASAAELEAYGIGAVDYGDDAEAARSDTGLTLWTGSKAPANREDKDLVLIRRPLLVVKSNRPPVVAGTEIQLFADDIRPAIHAPAGVVNDWLDSSGSGSNSSANQYIENRKPAYVAAHADFNGRPAVDFDGILNQMVIHRAARIEGPYTLVFVAKNESLAGASEQALFDGIAGGDAADRVAFFTNRLGARWLWSGTYLEGPGATTELRLHEIHIGPAGVGCVIRTNGVEAGTGDIGGGVMDGLRIGTSAGATSAFNGQIAFVRGVPRALTADERTADLAFFAGYYGGAI